MVLIGERGYAGASLRALAKQVGVSQPSLYHYFSSKAELVEQVIDYVTGTLFPEPAAMPQTASLEELIQGACGFTLLLYQRDDYVAFIRFLFAISKEGGAWKAILKDRFVDGWQDRLRTVCEPLIRSGELMEDDLQHLGNLIGGPMILEMLNQRVLLGETLDMAVYVGRVQFLTETLAAGLRARAARRRVHG